MARLTSPPRPELRWRHMLDDHVIAVGWSADGSRLAAASVAGPVTLFDVSSGVVKHTLPGHGFGTTALNWHPDGKRLATAGQDGKVRLWEASTGREVVALDGGAAWVEHVAWGPKGDFLVSAAGKKLRLWDREGNLAKAYPDALHTIADVVWSPLGKEFAAAGYGGVTFFRPDADRPVNQFAWRGSVLALAWSPDGNMLAGGAQDATVHFWYMKTGEDLQMAGYPNKVRELSWDPMSRFLATGGGEAVVVWDCSADGPAGSKPLMFELHAKPLSAVAFQHRGPVLASGAPDGKVGFWYPGGT
ncbi:MAG TPA: WD40 repeat domain-containing protein, partial [Gemmataceae bacterium]|nr:WD40 repeat domain-containing protein [Gemmataceae bacterium]